MLSLYFHIPFCEKKCNYCSFFIIPKFENKSTYDSFKIQYLRGLLDEIKDKKKEFSLKKEQIYTIYFGGGTPSEFGLENIFNLLLEINKEFDLSGLKEFSFELNPNLSSKLNTNETVQFIKSLYYFVYKLNSNTKIRFSIGIQSLEDDILAHSGRTYDSAFVIELLDKLFNLDFKNLSLNLDFISFGIEKKFSKFEKFVNKYQSIIDSYSIYALELFPGSVWLDKYNTNEEKILDNFGKYKEIVEKYGYKRYEISNFSKPGKESLHNKVYWDMGEYLGIGSSASGFVNNIRYTNSYSVNDYINGKFSYKEYKKLSRKEFLQEKIFLGLRKAEGIKLENDVLNEVDKDKLNYYIENNYLNIKNGYLFLTDKGFDVYNYVLTDLLEF